MQISLDAIRKEYSQYGKKSEKAFRLVESRGIKLNRFNPSGRRIWIIVGGDGDLLVDDVQPFCSCRHFHYRVLGGKDEICYHLVALQIAKRTGNYDTINFQDEEYTPYLRYLLQDITQAR